MGTGLSRALSLFISPRQHDVYPRNMLRHTHNSLSSIPHVLCVSHKFPSSFSDSVHPITIKALCLPRALSLCAPAQMGEVSKRGTYLSALSA